MFASHTQQTIALPSEPGQTVTIRKLSGAQYDEAQFDHMLGVAKGRGRNWASTFLRRAAAGTATAADATKVLRDPLSGFDRIALVKGGVVAWTFEDAGTPTPVTAAAIEDLEDEPLELLATAILKLTKPALFLTVEDTEATLKNASGSSSAG